MNLTLNVCRRTCMFSQEITAICQDSNMKTFTRIWKHKVVLYNFSTQSSCSAIFVVPLGKNVLSCAFNHGCTTFFTFSSFEKWSYITASFKGPKLWKSPCMISDRNVDVPGVQISSLGWSEVSCWLYAESHCHRAAELQFCDDLPLGLVHSSVHVSLFHLSPGSVQWQAFPSPKTVYAWLSCRWLSLELPRLWWRVLPVHDLPFYSQIPNTIQYIHNKFLQEWKTTVKSGIQLSQHWKINAIIYANDQVLIAKSEDELRNQRTP
jgi:hypothetical protein